MMAAESAPVPVDLDRWVDTKAAAAFSGFSPATLSGWRWQGRGPTYIKVGRTCRYKLRDVETFLRAHAKGASCAE